MGWLEGLSNVGYVAKGFTDQRLKDRKMEIEEEEAAQRKEIANRQKAEWARQDKQRQAAEQAAKPGELTEIQQSPVGLQGPNPSTVYKLPDGREFYSRETAQTGLSDYNSQGNINDRVRRAMIQTGDYQGARDLGQITASDLAIDKARRDADRETKLQFFGSEMTKLKNPSLQQINDLASQHGIGYGDMVDFASKTFNLNAAELNNNIVRRTNAMTQAFQKGGIQGIATLFNSDPMFGDGQTAVVTPLKGGKIKMSVYGQELIGTPNEVAERAIAWATNPVTAAKLERDIEAHRSKMAKEAAEAAKDRGISAYYGAGGRGGASSKIDPELDRAWKFVRADIDQAQGTLDKLLAPKEGQEINMAEVARVRERLRDAKTREYEVLKKAGELPAGRTLRDHLYMPAPDEDLRETLGLIAAGKIPEQQVDALIQSVQKDYGKIDPEGAARTIAKLQEMKRVKFSKGGAIPGYGLETKPPVRDLTSPTTNRYGEYNYKTYYMTPQELTEFRKQNPLTEEQ